MRCYRYGHPSIPLTVCFAGNNNYAAITAVFAANIVLVAYIVTSILEDRKSLEEAEGKKLAEAKKHR